MADVVRLRILKAMTNLFETEINPTNGYSVDLSVTTDVPQRVFRGRVIFGNDDPVPMMSILETPVPEDAKQASGNKITQASRWELILQGFVEDDLENPTDPAYPFLSDVKRCLASEKERDRGDDIFGLGEKFITDIHIGTGVVRPPDEVSAKAYFWLTLGLDIVENLLCPND